MTKSSAFQFRQIAHCDDAIVLHRKITAHAGIAAAVDQECVVFVTVLPSDTTCEYHFEFANPAEDAGFRDMQLGALRHIARTAPERYQTVGSFAGFSVAPSNHITFGTTTGTIPRQTKAGR